MDLLNTLFSQQYNHYTMLTLSLIVTVTLSMPIMVTYIDYYYDKKEKQKAAEDDFTVKPSPELEDVASSQQSEPSPQYEPRIHLITLRATQTEAELIMNMIPASEYLTDLDEGVGVNHRIVVYTERRRANSF